MADSESIPVTLQGLQKVEDLVNNAYGSHIVTVKMVNDEIIILVGASTVRMTTSIIKAIDFLGGLKRGIELMKGDI